MFTENQRSGKCSFITWGLIGMMMLTASCSSKKTDNIPVVPKNEAKGSPGVKVGQSPHHFAKGVGELDKDSAQLLVGFGLATPYSTGIMPKCVTGAEPSVDPLEDRVAGSQQSPDGQYVNVRFENVRSEIELERMLDVRVQGKAKFIAVNSDASGEFSKVLKRNQQSLHYLYTVDVDNAFVRLKDVQLTPEAIELEKTGGRQKFYEKCGRQYVAGYKSGGRASFLASLEAKEINISETKAILAQASGITWNANAQFKEEAREKLKSSNFTFVSSYTGGNGFTLSENFEGLISLINKWPEHVSKHPVIKELVLQDYDSLLAGIDDIEASDLSEQIEILDESYSRLSEKIFAAYAGLRSVSPTLAKDPVGSMLVKNAFVSDLAEATKIQADLKNYIRNCQRSYTFENCNNPELVASAELFKFKNIDVKQVPDLSSSSCVKSDKVKEPSWTEGVITSNHERKSCGGWNGQSCPAGETVVNQHHDTGGKCNLSDNYLYFKWSCQKLVVHEPEKTVDRTPDQYTNCEMKTVVSVVSNGHSLGM